MIWILVVATAFLTCLCGMAISNMFENQEKKKENRK